MELKLNIQGMHCEHCVNSVRDAITHLPEVSACDVRIGCAMITFASQSYPVSEVIEAVHRAGPFHVAGFDRCD